MLEYLIVATAQEGSDSPPSSRDSLSVFHERGQVLVGHALGRRLEEPEAGGHRAACFSSCALPELRQQDVRPEGLGESQALVPPGNSAGMSELLTRMLRILMAVLTLQT